MYAATYLANNINTEWSTTFTTFNSAVLLIVANLIWQYFCGSGHHPFNDPDVRAFIITLVLEFIAVLAGLLLGFHYGIYLCVLGGLIGFLMPLLVYRQFIPNHVNFPHLVERLSLIIIIYFGEALVNVTQYFTRSLFRPLPLMIFVLLASLFGLYLVQSDRLINHHQHTRGFVLMYSHVFMIVAILSLTAGLDYLAAPTVNRTALWLLLTASVLTYNVYVFANGVYNHKQYRMSITTWGWLLLLVISGAAISFIFRAQTPGILSGLVLASVGEVSYFLGRLVYHQ